MNQNNHKQFIYNKLIFILVFSPIVVYGQVPQDGNIYIHAEFGKKENTGSKENVFWVLDKEEENTFTLSNSVLIGYNELVNKGGGPRILEQKPIPI